MSMSHIILPRVLQLDINVDFLKVVSTQRGQYEGHNTPPRPSY